MPTKLISAFLTGQGYLALFTGMSLTFATLACQTTSTPLSETATKSNFEKKVLDSQLTLAQNALDSGQPQKSHAILRELLQKHPENQQLHNFMGLTQLALGNPKRAILHFEKSYQIDPEIGVGLNLSSAYIEAGDYKNALIRLKSLTEEAKTRGYPYQERIFHNIGLTLVKLKKVKASRMWFQRAIEENPTFFPTHLEIGRLHLSEKNWQNAKLALQKSHDYCLPCWEPVELLVSIYRELHQFKEANLLLLSYLKTPELDDSSKKAAQGLLQELLALKPEASKKQHTALDLERKAPQVR